MRDSRGHARAVSVLLLAALAGCGGSGIEEPQGPASPTQDATGSSIPDSTEPVALEAGTYQIPNSAWSSVDFAVTFPQGWTVQYGASFRKNPETNDGVGFESFVPDTIYANACAGSGGEKLVVGPSADDLTAALLEQRGTKAGDAVETTLGGYPATRIDLTVPAGLDLEECSLEGAGLQIWFSHPADGYLVVFPDSITSVYIVDVDVRRQVFQTIRWSATSDEDVRELDAVLDSISLET
jgi:hypothetical protein